VLTPRKTTEKINRDRELAGVVIAALTGKPHDVEELLVTGMARHKLGRVEGVVD
jgi:hypothetical protein